MQTVSIWLFKLEVLEKKTIHTEVKNSPRLLIQNACYILQHWTEIQIFEPSLTNKESA